MVSYPSAWKSFLHHETWVVDPIIPGSRCISQFSQAWSEEQFQRTLQLVEDQTSRIRPGTLWELKLCEDEEKDKLKKKHDCLYQHWLIRKAN